MSTAAAPVVQSDPAQDHRFMQLALALGRRGLGRTWPNPAVGAVVVKDNVILGRGWTQPCADAIIRAGIARVVSAMEDPNPEVAGQGHARLRERGIAVETGLGGEEAARTNVGHIRRMRDGRPHVMLKLAVSADGKVGAAGRRPVAITGEAARTRVHQMRAQSDAILVGIGTVLSDDPALTCRLPGMAAWSPVRVVLDARLRVPLAAGVIATVRETPTWVFTAPGASAMGEEILRAKGAEVFRVADNAGRLDLGAVLQTLGDHGITRLMVEGGPTVAASFVQARLVDQAVLLRSQKQLGADGIDALAGLPLTALTGSLTPLAPEQLGDDTAESYERA